MRLLQPARLNPMPALESARFGPRQRLVWSSRVAERGLHQAQQFTLLHRAGGGDHNAVRGVEAAVELAEPVRRGGREARNLPQDWPP